MSNPLIVHKVRRRDPAQEGDEGAPAAGNWDRAAQFAVLGIFVLLLIAAFDLARWTASLQALLPNPQATINCPNLGGPPSCTIQITWSETAVAMTQQEAQQQVATGATAQFQTPTYLLYVEP